MTYDDASALIDENAQLKKENKKLKTRIAELEKRLGKNSSNSDKPPSSDGLKKTNKNTSLREKTDRKPGGQKGRKGTTLKQIKNPDKVIKHQVEKCENCNLNLQHIKSNGELIRQVFSYIPARRFIVEHRSDSKICPCCSTKNDAFPEGVNASVQLGNELKGLINYYNVYQHLPYERIVEVIKETLDINISEGSIYNANLHAYNNLEEFEKDVEQKILNSKTVGFDETPYRMMKSLYWMYTHSTPLYTLFKTHKNRSWDAMLELGIYPNFKNMAVHDFYAPYLKNKDCDHALCNAHHLRKLKALKEDGEVWADKMFSFLCEVKDSQYSDEAYMRYDEIVSEGLKYHESLEPLEKSKNGKQKQRDGKNLLDRFVDYKDWVLNFLHDKDTPFTNNHSERDFRMTKLKQKISGCFRSETGAEMFARIRSYISTARKHNHNILSALTSVHNKQTIIF